MGKPILTTADYKKLLRFSSIIHAGTDNYMTHIMKALQTCFGYTLTSYSVFDTPKENLRVNMNCMDSLCFERYFLEQCIVAAQTDTKLYPYLLRARNSNDWNGICYSQDMEGFQNTTFYKVFRVRQIDYAAYLLLLDQPEIILYILKPSTDGPFSPHEKLLLAEIQKILAPSMENYVRQQFQSIAKNALGNILSNASVGCLVMEDSMHYLWYNKIFSQILCALYGFSDGDRLARTFRKDVEAETNCPLLELQGSRKILGNRFLIHVERVYTTNTQNIGQQYAVCTLRQIDSDDERTCTIPEPVLTKREEEIWGMIISGMSNEEIAAKLSISIHTVKTHISNLFRKLNVSSRLEATLLKIENKGK